MRICPWQALSVLILGGWLATASPSVAQTADDASHLAASAVAIERNPDAFAPVAAAIGGARIVMLGEPWHGDGRAMRERARLVRYLHERHGFDVLVFEADFYALHQAWAAAASGTKPSSILPDNVYPFWGRTDAMRDLWAYVDARAASERPLAIAGVDTKVTGALTTAHLPDDLRVQLRGVVGEDEAAAAAGVLDRLLNRVEGDTVSQAEFAVLEQAVARLEQALRAGDARNGFWAQMAQSLRRQLSGEARDPGMAENLIWLATRLYPDRKIIVWAHNNHIATDKWMLYDAQGPEITAAIGRESARSKGRRTYMGEAVRFYFGDRAVYALGLISGTGRYSSEIAPALSGRAFDPSVTAALPPAGPGTLEHALEAAGHDLAFINLNAIQAGPVRSRVLDYSQLPPLPLDLSQGFDGLLYINHTYGLDEPDADTRPVTSVAPGS